MFSEGSFLFMQFKSLITSLLSFIMRFYIVIYLQNRNQTWRMIKDLHSFNLRFL